MKKNLLNIAIIISIISLISKISGFVRDIILASTFGITRQIDAFFTAQMAVGVIPTIFFVVIETIFLPMLATISINRNKNEIDQYVNVVYTILFIVLMVSTAVISFFLDEIIWFFSPDFSDGTHLLTLQLTKILLPTVFISLLLSLDSVLLKHNRNFFVPEIIGLPMNIAIIIYLLMFSHQFGIVGMAYTVIIGVLIQYTIQVTFVKKLNIKFSRIDFNYNDNNFKKMSTLMIPILIGISIHQINFIIERIIASGLNEGSIAALTYANRLNVFVLSFVSVSLASIYYKSVSVYAAEKNIQGMKQLINKTISILVFLFVPATFGMMILYHPITKFVYQRGSFDSFATELTSGVFFWYSLGLVGYALREILVRAFYAIQDTKTAMINGAIAIILNIASSFILTSYMDVNGLALSMSISGLISSILLLVSLHKKIGSLGMKSVCILVIKVIIASVIMGVFVWYFDDFNVFIRAVIGIIVYSLTSKLLKVEELNAFWDIIKRLFIKSQTNN